MELWIARDKNNRTLHLYFSKPIRLEERGFFYAHGGGNNEAASVSMNKRNFPK